MDIISHGLWGGVILGRENKRNFWWSFLIGLSPDLLSFGVFTVMTILGFASGLDWSAGPPPENLVPAYVHTLYDITHSLIVFALVFFAVWLVRKKPFLPLLAWGIPVFMDIFTHSTQFFPTPFLWPLFDNIRFKGVPWSHPAIFLTDVVLLLVFYIWFFVVKKRIN